MALKKLFSIGFMAFVSTAWAATGADNHSMRPGSYEMTTQTSIEGMDRALPAKTHRHCFSAEDVKDAKRTASAGNENCETTDFKTAANRVTWSQVCSQFHSKGSGEIVYSADGFEMTTKMESNGGPRGPMKLTIRTTAKRIGECK